MGKVKRADWSPKKRATAVTLRNEGYSYQQIARKIGQGVTASGVRKLCVRFAETGSIVTASGKGRKRSTSKKTDRRICRLSLQNRGATSREINKVLSDSGVQVSDRTVRRRLVNGGLQPGYQERSRFLTLCKEKNVYSGPKIMFRGLWMTGKK